MVIAHSACTVRNFAVTTSQPTADVLIESLATTCGQTCKVCSRSNATTRCANQPCRVVLHVMCAFDFPDDYSIPASPPLNNAVACIACATRGFEDKHGNSWTSELEQRKGGSAPPFRNPVTGKHEVQ